VNRTKAEPALWVAAIAGLSAAALGASAGFASTAFGLIGGIAVLCALGIVVALVVLPLRVLPGFALLAYVFLPQQLIGLGGVYAGASPAAVVLAVWAVRKLVARMNGSGVPATPRMVAGARLCVGGVLVWGIVLFQGADTAAAPADVSIRWLVSFGLAVVLPSLVLDNRDELMILWRVLPVVTVISAAYAVAEFALSYNVIYSPLYEALGRPLAASAGVYRSHGSFGHPLYASTFFAVAFALAFARWFSGARGSVLWMACGLAGLLVTVSRGGLVAAGAGALIVLVAAAIRGEGRVGKYLGAGAVLGVGSLVVLGIGLVQQRVGTGEAATSSQVRDRVYPLALGLADLSGWRGAGAGTSDVLVLHYTHGAYPLENSYLQILVSLGVVGLLGFTAFFACAGLHAVRARNWVALAGSTAFATSIYGYNAIETVLPMHVLLGLLVLAMLARAEPEPAAPACVAGDMSASGASHVEGRTGDRV
jgi:polysaccharide biosynthesis protein PslJ